MYPVMLDVQGRPCLVVGGGRVAARKIERLLDCGADVAVVSLVGQKIRAMLPVIGPALEVFQENRIHLVSQAASPEEAVKICPWLRQALALVSAVQDPSW